MTDPDDELRPLLDFIKLSRGFDFSGYKPTSLTRRVRKRMDAIGSDSYADYLNHLEVEPDEFSELFDTILINVTSFFRDAPAWRYVDEQVLPAIIGHAGSRDIRIWSAGCASGEEAYSISMLLVRHLGERAFRERVKVYATDVDDDALATARAGQYTSKQLEAVPADLLERCFERLPAGAAFRKDLRRALIFGRNDLVQDAPISRIDLLLCRNVLMYFNAETQGSVLRRLNFALANTGYLFLGKSEMLLTRGELFRPVDLKCRVFSKVPVPRLGEHLMFTPDGDENADPALGDSQALGLRDGVLDLAPVAQLAVDLTGMLAMANQQARTLFGLEDADIGRPLRDLEVSYRPVELRAAIDRALAEARPVSLGTVQWGAEDGQPRELEVQVSAVVSDGGELLGASATFADVTPHLRLRDELERSKRELEVAYEELQSTVEELETTNEELQSTNEELETTNEELQSTNEELETMNEELQSTNEELEATNDELRDRSQELNESNIFLEAILGSVGVAVVVLDEAQAIRVWNRAAQALWGLRPDQVRGEHFLSLDIGLPVEQLRAALRAALAGDRTERPLALEARDRCGRDLTCYVTCVPLSGLDGEVRGAVLLMDDRTPVRAA
ncbi:CheR family methyltransferase [Capillimicrobium parvum]|uniref:protein-glutamate O-methyltransferase n=1 Tax=Capillimicrobium parvum TaxID=2884022 RepID=A0A9E7C1E9_9ACTN|nr:CheR family methyltransferase [Capillimicrobium parvum]UGS36614.1 hypothetical protein DSM104329_03022 [Capillimicrobium parvum]